MHFQKQKANQGGDKWVESVAPSPPFPYTPNLTYISRVNKKKKKSHQTLPMGYMVPTPCHSTFSQVWEILSWIPERYFPHVIGLLLLLGFFKQCYYCWHFRTPKARTRHSCSSWRRSLSECNRIAQSWRELRRSLSPCSHPKAGSPVPTFVISHRLI